MVSILTAGGEHGTPTPTLLLYPFFFLSSVFESDGGFFVWALLLGQFPLYGLIIDIGKLTSRQLVAIGLVTALHVTLSFNHRDIQRFLETMGVGWCSIQLHAYQLEQEKPR